MKRTLVDTSFQLNRPSPVAVLSALTVIVLLVGMVAMPVAAHAYLSESDPANGEQVDEAPEEVTLYFSGDGVQVADVTVTGPDGTDVSDDARIDPDDTQIVHVPLEDDGDGMYTVTWEVLADDGHTTSGSFFFVVGDEPIDRDTVLEAYDGDEQQEEVSAFEAGAKGLTLVGLVGLVGIPITLAGAVYPLLGRFGSSRSAATVDRRAVRLLAGMGLVLFGSVGALGVARSRSLEGPFTDAIAQFVATPLGSVWLIQLALSAALVVVLATAVLGVGSRRTWLGGALLGGVLLSVTVGWTSHSATAIDRLQGLTVDVAHILGAGLWVGGLVVLAVVVPPLLRGTPPEDRAALAAGIVRRYSVIALLGVTLAATTGFLLAAWHVPTVDGMTETLYGLTLLAKTGLVLVAVALGGYTRFVLLRRLEGRDERGVVDRVVGRGADRRVREDGGHSTTLTTYTRAVRFEVVVLLVVILLSGLLTTAPTAAVVGPSDGPGEATLEAGDDDLLIELTAFPGADDGGWIHVDEDDPVVFDVSFTSGDDRLESDRPVRILATHAEEDVTIEVELEETDDGVYTTVQTLPESGEWELRISGTPDGQFVSEWFDAHVSTSVADGTDHDDHDHDEHDHDHDEHDEHAGHDHDHSPEVPELEDDDGPSEPFVAILQFGAVAVAIGGGFAVTFEALRLRDRDGP